MSHSKPPLLFAVSIVMLTLFSFFSTPTHAQGTPTFSVDYQGPIIGTPDGFGVGLITEGDLLAVSVPAPAPNPPLLGPVPPPGLLVSGTLGGPGVFPGGYGLVPSFAGPLEIDAFSFGKDFGDKIHFSVDEFAAGVFGIAPDVASEAAAAEASADVFMYLGMPIPTPIGPAIGNSALIDGNGLVPSGAPGLGFLEPNIPTPGITPDPGDNLDALDIDTMLADIPGPFYFSLDSGFPDPLEAGFPAPNSGTAVANGFSGSDVLVSGVGAGPALAIPAAALGLDFAGFDTDDIDALSFDDADLSGTLTPGDTLLFSVRRGSAVIGAPDSMFGIPIEEGDILTVPTLPGAVPAVFIAAEVLGLFTARAGAPIGDDLDAIDLSFVGMADLIITKSVAASTVPGTPVLYSMVATNAGPSALPAVHVTDIFHADLSGCSWSCSGSVGGTCSASGLGDISEFVGLPVGASVTFVASCEVSPSSVGTLSNTATIATPPMIFDPIPGNNSATTVTTLTPVVDLVISNTDGQTTSIPPTTYSYSIVVTNTGPSDVIGASVTDSFPAEVTNINWTCIGSSGGICGSASGTGDIMETVDVPVAGSVTFTATVDTNASAGAVVVNTATVTAAVGYIDSDLSNNSVSDTTTFIVDPDIIFENDFE
ncbi:hypothetical protein MNBD_GAMMA02-1771 [hydrothermal vent metagenome]|uniref:DUF11 domain-containing protein n=1 Tax=hydrothermal vent metagenome TaxID=652676 RepID=A0A3B0W0M6_9ZZZZ